MPASAEQFLQELCEKHDIEVLCFSSLVPSISRQQCSELGDEFRRFVMGTVLISNV